VKSAARTIERRRARARGRTFRLLRRFLRAEVTASYAARRLREHAPAALLAALVDGLLRWGDRLAARLERELTTRLGPLRADPVLNPCTARQGATGRLRRIAPGAVGIRARRRELAADITRAELRPASAPMHWTLEGAFVSALAAAVDLRGALRRLAAGIPINSLRGCSRPATI